MSLVTILSTPAGGFTPGSLGGLKAWFKPETLSTLSGDDPVSSWPDSSSAGIAAENAGGSVRPLYKTSEINGVAAVLFDGADDYLQQVSTFGTLSQPFHVFCVINQVSWTAVDTVFDGLVVNTGKLYQQSATPELRMYAGGQGPRDSSNATVGSYHWVECLFNGASSSIIVDNNSAQNSNNVGTGQITGMTLGAAGNVSSYGHVSIAELIACSGAVTGLELTNLRAYINGKYGLSTN